MGLFEAKQEPRDTYGPMDIDGDESMNRLEHLMLSQEDLDGPARKRLHSDLTSPSRTFSTPSKNLQATPQTPFLFHLSGVQKPPMPEFKGFHYDPSKFSSDRFNLGSSSTATATPPRQVFGLEDVEMRDSPIRFEPMLTPSASGSSSLGRTEVKPDEGPVLGAEVKPKVAETKSEEAKASVAGDEVDGSGRPIAQGGYNREMRRRQRKKNNGRKARVDSDDEVDEPRRSKKESRPYDPSSLKHSDIPALLLGYTQVLVNLSIVLFCLYLGLQFVLSVRRDVKDRMQEASVEILQEIAECSKLYLTNRCDPILRVPAMEAPCKAWEACMSKDPTMVGRTNVMAETFAGVINSFVETMSWKTMGFTLTTLSFLIILTNSALWNLRSKVESVPPTPPMYPPHMLQFGQHMPHQHQLGYGPAYGHPTGYVPGMSQPQQSGEPDMRQIEYPQETGKSKWRLW